MMPKNSVAYYPMYSYKVYNAKYYYTLSLFMPKNSVAFSYKVYNVKYV